MGQAQSTPTDPEKQAISSNGSTTANSKDKADTSNTGNLQRKNRNSLRWWKRPKDYSKTIDTCDIRVSRGSTRPVVASGTLWEDPCFPREMAMEGSRMETSYRWMRPKEFCKNPCLVRGEPSHHDVIQGSIGNCWMMATLAGIADHLSNLLEILGSRDYDPMSASYDGVFRCRFWYYGQWISIFVDDCLPVRQNPRAPMGFSLMGARSPDPDVLWVALVEKALAKFHGSYRSIEAREREYGWRLLTGGVPVILQQDKITRTPSGQLFDRIKLALDSGCIVTCSHPIQGGRLHAYTITGAMIHSVKGNIIRIRNPWGEEQTRISWLPSPEHWTYSDNERKEDFECKEGEFWVLRGECYREFTQYCIGCFKAEYYDESDKTSYILNHKYTYFDEWKGDKAAGHSITNVFNNPKYEVTVPGSKQIKKKRVLFELIPRPVDSNKGVSLYLYKIDKVTKAVLCQEYLDPGEKHVFLANGCPIFTYNLPPGSYLAIPLMERKGDERGFCLRMFSNSHISCKQISGNFFQIERGISRTSESDNTTPAKTKVQHYCGLWRSDLYVNDQRLPSVLNKIPQFQLKLPAEAKISLHIAQEYKSDNDAMSIRIYKIDDHTKLPLERDFLEKGHPQQVCNPMRAIRPDHKSTWSLQPHTIYLVLVFPWESTRDRHFVASFSSEGGAAFHCKPFNVT